MRDKKLIIKINLLIFILLVVLNTFLINPKYSAFPQSNGTSERGNHVTQSLKLTAETSKRPEEKNTPAEPVEWKKIVFWTEYFGKRDVWYKIFKRLLVSECEESRCHVIINSGEVGNADAVVFNGNDLRKSSYSFLEKRYEPPPIRREEQVYVFFSMEAPPMFHNIRLEDYENFFNWTMTYRKDSDVYVPYGLVTKRQTKRNASEIPYVTEEELQKKNMSLWMVSHCPVQSKRDDFVKELRRFMKIDTYGTCGKLKCGDRRTIPKVNDLLDDPCVSLYANYSFNMALENALCDDYVTEKLYRSLKLGIVPVVLGAVNYTDYAPPNSFIDAKEFTTYIDLGNHIKTVASDVQLYNNYFKWQEDYNVELGSPYKPFICDLCKKLHAHTPESPKKIYSSIKDWYMKQGKCYKFTD